MLFHCAHYAAADDDDSEPHATGRLQIKQRARGRQLRASINGDGDDAADDERLLADPRRATREKSSSSSLLLLRCRPAGNPAGALASLGAAESGSGSS